MCLLLCDRILGPVLLQALWLTLLLLLLLLPKRFH
jgi:hypothetical protein